MKNFRRYVGRRSAALLTALCFAATLPPPSSAQLDQWGYWENGVTESWWLASSDFTAEDAVNSVARWRSIGAENEGAARGAWAGDYFSGGETHGTYMRWAPRSGFIIAHVDKCQARVMGVTYGRAQASSGLVEFFPEFNKAVAKGHGHTHRHEHTPSLIRFVPVKWRAASHLIPEDEMDDFGDYLAGLGDYNHWAGFWSGLGHDPFFVRFGPGEDSAEESAAKAGADAAVRPVVPPGYERFLKQPIEASVTAVGRRLLASDITFEGRSHSSTHARASLVRVRVSAGTERGVTDGMVFRVIEPDHGDTVRIVRAGKKSSTGLVVRDIDEDGEETYYAGEAARPIPYPRVKAGWKLTTSPFPF